MKTARFVPPLAVVLALFGLAQQSDILIKLTRQERVAIALPDFRGSGQAQGLMGVFNRTLYEEIESSGLFRIVPKSLYPLEVPQQPEDFREPLPPPAPRRGETPRPVRRGPWLTDWSEPPVSATYLAFGYSGVVEGRLVLRGWLYNVTQPNSANAQIFGKMYFGSLDEAGARQVAREFAADILQQFGYKGLAGTKIYYESERGGVRELWRMDPDGTNQEQLTFHKSLVMGAAISPDRSLIAYGLLTPNGWVIRLQSLLTGGRVAFFNAPGTLNWTPDFTPDGKRIVFASNTAREGNQEIYIADLDGRNLQRLTFGGRTNAEPKVNPRTGAEIVFVSDRGGSPQIYRMSITGADVERLTDGEGQAVNPAWHPDGQHIAFAWTKGFAPGNFNIFVMDVATREVIQLTHGAGRNENPTWAPDGRHIAFSSTRDGSPQIYTMLADGTQVKRLTNQGRNFRPVWK